MWKDVDIINVIIQTQLPYVLMSLIILYKSINKVLLFVSDFIAAFLLFHELAKHVVYVIISLNVCSEKRQRKKKCSLQPVQILCFISITALGSKSTP